MASENVDDWDQPLTPTPSGGEEGEEEDQEPSDERYRRENIEKLQKYVERMAYRPVPPKLARKRTEELAKPKKVVLMDNLELFGNIVVPKQRGQRLQRLWGKYTAITSEQLEEAIKNERQKQRKKEDLHKHKEEIYYEMLTKLERQCREQYLDMLIKKFSNFVARLATTMRIPPQLVEPYARMHRSLFCNILLAIDVHPTNPRAFYYNTEEGLEYDVCHKLAHALLSLIIKALDSASSKNADDFKVQPLDTDFEMDNYIKDRLMCAAHKKVTYAKKRTKGMKIKSSFKKCKW